MQNLAAGTTVSDSTPAQAGKADAPTPAAGPPPGPDSPAVRRSRGDAAAVPVYGAAGKPIIEVNIDEGTAPPLATGSVDD